jgi:hypothetical protein
MHDWPLSTQTSQVHHLSDKEVKEVQKVYKNYHRHHTCIKHKFISRFITSCILLNSLHKSRPFNHEIPF